MKRQAIGGGVLLVAAVTLLSGCGGGIYAATPVMTIAPTTGSDPRVGSTYLDPAGRGEPLELSGETADGTPLSTRDSLGQVTVINAWASWCPPCIDELPLLSRAYDATRDDAVAFLGVNSLDDPIAAAGLLATTPYRSIDDREGTLLASIPGIPPSGLPSTVILDRDGRIAATIIGPIGPGQLEPLIDRVLAES